ncbi:tudor domain-containing protein 5-like [Syngnathus typhle]|uniref:tudor domain-containing protein 5-like n=1 Tax=Syngnathus typhle TaxID=161592 RepID=UPI002A6A3809|nr:tudor domain-containing protein 5-like [Syngnathus typhle]
MHLLTDQMDQGTMNPDVVLAKLKKDVRSLLISSKVDLDPELLKRDYKNMVGHPLPLKLLGFPNVMDMLKEIPDVVSVNVREDGKTFLKAVSHESTRNIEELVAKQRMSMTDKRRKNWQCSSNGNCYRSAPLILPRRGGAPPALPPQLRAQLRLLLSQGPVKLSELDMSFQRCFGRPLRVHNLGFYSTGEMLEAAADLVLIQQGRFGSMLTLREQMLPRTFNAKQSLGPLKATTHAGLDTPAKSQDTTVSSVHEEPPHVSCNLQGIDKTQEPEPQLHQKSLHFHQHFSKMQEELRQQIAENGVAATISHELKEKLQKVVGQSSCGISVHHLPEEYKRLLAEDLPLKENGFVSVTELVDAMSDIFDLQYVDGDSKCDWIVKNTTSDALGGTWPQTNCRAGESLWDVKDGHISVDAAEELLTMDYSVEQEQASELCPAVAVYCSPVVPLDALQSQHLERPTPRPSFEWLQVTVVQVESPGLFYVRFTGCEEAQTFEKMKVEMTVCYSSPDVSERYRLPRPFIRRGQVCCASSEDTCFTRGVIHQLISSTSVEVYHVDFGTVTTVRTDGLMFLKSRFSVLPAQAVPSSLAGIQATTVSPLPAEGAWTSEAIASFVALCNRPPVAGLVCHAGDVLHLCLCDTHTEQDIHIHNVLISQGHGEPCGPSASAAVCDKVSPVRLYLGEGTFHLPDVDEGSIWPAETLEQSELEAEEKPSLEFIGDNESNADVQPENPSRQGEKQEFGGTETSAVYPPFILRTQEKIQDNLFHAIVTGANLKREKGLGWFSSILLPRSIDGPADG